MVKAKLSKMTENWIDGKPEKSHTVKTERQQNNIEKVKQTLYISREAAKLLWYNRIETKETISEAVERLVTKHLQRK